MSLQVHLPHYLRICSNHHEPPQRLPRTTIDWLFYSLTRSTTLFVGRKFWELHSLKPIYLLTTPTMVGIDTKNKEATRSQTVANIVVRKSLPPCNTPTIIISPLSMIIIVTTPTPFQTFGSVYMPPLIGTFNDHE